MTLLPAFLFLAAADPAIDFTKDVKPILAAKCTVCHSGTQTEGKYDMGTRDGILKGGKKGVAVVPGKAAESNLYLFSSRQKKPVMPPRSENNEVTDAELAVLKAWIDQGAKGPAAGEAPAKVEIQLTAPNVAPVRAAAVRPDKTLAYAGKGTQILVFDAKTGLQTKAVPAHVSLIESMAASPDGKMLATGSFREVTLWNAETLAKAKTVGGFSHNVTALAFSPDGRSLAVGGGPPTEDGELKLIDPATGAIKVEFKNPHSDTVFGVAFSPDGKLLASAGADKFVKVWDAASGKFVKSFEGHTGHVLDVAWSADGKKLYSGGADAIIKVWDYEKGEKIKDVKGHDKQVTRVVGLTNGFLTCGGDGQVKQWNADGGQGRAYPARGDFVYAVAASADGGVVISGGEDGVVTVLDGKTGQPVVPPAAGPAKKK